MNNLARLKGLLREKRPPDQPSKGSKAPFESIEGSRSTPFSRPDALPDASASRLIPDMADIEAAMVERAALAAESVPAEYLDVWARVQVVRPAWASRNEWPGLIDAAGRFLDQWGEMAAEFGWTPEDLFGRDGLIRFMSGESVRALGPEQAALRDGRVFKSKGDNNG